MSSTVQAVRPLAFLALTTAPPAPEPKKRTPSVTMKKLWLRPVDQPACIDTLIALPAECDRHLGLIQERPHANNQPSLLKPDCRSVSTGTVSEWHTGRAEVQSAAKSSLASIIRPRKLRCGG